MRARARARARVKAHRLHKLQSPEFCDRLREILEGMESSIMALWDRRLIRESLPEVRIYDMLLRVFRARCGPLE